MICVSVRVTQHLRITAALIWSRSFSYCVHAAQDRHICIAFLFRSQNSSEQLRTTTRSITTLRQARRERPVLLSHTISRCVVAQLRNPSVCLTQSLHSIWLQSQQHRETCHRVNRITKRFPSSEFSIAVAYGRGIWRWRMRPSSDA